MASLITLTTDFGAADWFVGVMKGVIAGIAPEARVINLTHEVPPGNIRAGAFALTTSYRFFPKRTIHVAVVDPGVGSKRKPILVRTKNYVFIGPDNGLLSWALRHEKILTIRSLENPKYSLHPLSRTFHGRDLFAPVAAHVSLGLAIQKLGPELTDCFKLPWPEAQCVKDRLQGEVLYIDRFGNAITNISAEAVEELTTNQTSATHHASRITYYASNLTVWHCRKKICAVREFYQVVPHSQPVAVIGSTGFLEIAVNGGNAEKSLKLRVGDAVIVRRT